MFAWSFKRAEKVNIIIIRRRRRRREEEEEEEEEKGTCMLIDVAVSGDRNVI